ncbi:MAG: polysaccharide biosynthesis/export family protein, partial [Dokdonella sp.]|nr:polysaccharide biosynthesis/export family protein [Dokdonella sp.]
MSVNTGRQLEPRGIIMRWLPLLALTMILPLAACTTTTRPSTYLVETKGPYTLDTGDAVRVTVYGDAELSNTYRVNDSGAVAFPLVGPV